jgi:flavin reductase (DIM6/NTAB) family NADH-FMN oxidoreductase RutF
MLSYHHDKDKFETAGLTPIKLELVHPDRNAECPMQREAEMAASTR